LGCDGDGVGSTPGYFTSLILYVSVGKWLPGIRTHHFEFFESELILAFRLLKGNTF